MSELIDREALRAAHGLGADCHDCKRDMKSCQYDRDYSLMDFCEWLDDAPAVSPWHRVEEPPKSTGRYIVWCGVNWHGEGMYGDIMIARYDRNKKRWYVEADNSLNGPLCGDVRYWMPIEPPKEDE